MREVTDHYWSAILNTKRVLRQYFTSDSQMLQFYDMMSETGAIVSGSTALQLFARTSFVDTDLDVYVEKTGYERALRHMQLSGFRRIEQDDSKLDAVIGDSYPFVEEIERVQGMVTSGLKKVVQVIATNKSPGIMASGRERGRESVRSTQASSDGRTSVEASKGGSSAAAIGPDVAGVWVYCETKTL